MELGKTISIIIPTLNAGENITKLLEGLSKQSYPIERIMVIDSRSTDDTAERCKAFPKVEFSVIERKAFDHGGTRDVAIKSCDTDVVVTMTQDAGVFDPTLIEKLIAPLNGNVVASFARQIAREDASIYERFVRAFNYPEQAKIKDRSCIETMGIKAFYSSDVCCAYDRESYLALGGFEHPIKTNEDMLFAAKAIVNGYAVSYTAEATIVHSHNLTLKEQYRRNYIVGYEMERFRNLLCGVKDISEGGKLVKYVSKELLKRGKLISFICFGFDCVARFLGNRAGRRAYRKEQVKA